MPGGHPDIIRVSRPGARIGLLSWTPEGMIGALLRTLGPFAPLPAPGAQPPPLWGREAHLAELFGADVDFTALKRNVLNVSAFERPRDFGEHFKVRYGPTIAAQANARRNGRDAEFEAAGKNQSETARRLGVSRPALIEKLHKYGLIER